jgi:hypothetical protein
MDNLYHHSATPQIAVDPYRDVLVEANQEACRLMRLDRAGLKAIRPSDLFKPDLPKLVVFTQEVLEKTRGLCSDLTIVIQEQECGIEVFGRFSQVGEERL